MFSGLVAGMGVLERSLPRGHGARLYVRGSFADGPLALGESIAVDGCCLSVAGIFLGGFEADASSETLARTTLGTPSPNRVVNLERALRAGDRLGGHLVTGHIDGVGTVLERQDEGDARALTFELPARLARFVAEKGSIAVSGVSLTVNGVEARRFGVMLIPITLAETNLGALGVGDQVNLEVDLVARYVARLVDRGTHADD
ncbi:MAG: riboflavin synthase [Myxococcota bacterium]|nr:riboflavin synthase [Myxococcota bacterium]